VNWYSPTLFVSPTSFPHMSAAAATLAAKSETLSTGPRTVGMMEPRKTRISGSHEIFESCTCELRPISLQAGLRIGSRAHSGFVVLVVLQAEEGGESSDW
jgi:hypothetical protein